MQVPRFLLIYCEGRTEEQYFVALRDVLRIGGVQINIVSNSEQHEALIDACKEEKSRLEAEIDEEVEAWSVCDRDDYSKSFTKLNDYAKQNEIQLAFSDPQFENYILQHFGGPSKSRSRGEDVEKEVSVAMLAANLGTVYSKGDLGWLCDIINKNPNIVEVAIKNANIYSNHTMKPFFTVQKLASRLFGLSALGNRDSKSK